MFEMNPLRKRPLRVLLFYGALDRLTHKLDNL